MIELMHQVAVVWGYIFMLAGGLGLVAYLVMVIVDYIFRQMKAAQAFYEFVVWRDKQAKKKAQP